MSIEKLRDSVKRHYGLFIVSSVLMVLAGVLAIALPLAAGIGVSIFVSWLIFLTGIAHLVYAFAAREVGAFLLRLLLGLCYIVGGVYLAVHPGLGLASLTLALAAILFAEGVTQIMTYFNLRALPGSAWILFDGIVTLALGLMIGLSWPWGSSWAIGTIVGVNFLFSGLTRLGYGLTARKLLHS
jgi:uncharacterized membrane protein HdeD (DUF308 family)